MDKTINCIIEKAKKDRLVLAVALFGSYARNEQHNDIDVCIFLKSKIYSQLQLSKKKLEYQPDQEKYDVQIFQQLPLYIRKRILKEGRILYCHNEEELYDVYFTTIKDFELFEPYYEQYLAAVADG